MIASSPSSDEVDPRPSGRRLAWGMTKSFRMVLLAASMVGCRPHSQSTIASPQGAIVYVDLETGQPVVQLATTEVPTVHPDTGGRTLMPGLYCSACRRWHPAPPFDRLQRSPGAAQCAVHGIPLTIDGPWPTGDSP